jgi:hypothetical protein
VNLRSGVGDFSRVSEQSLNETKFEDTVEQLRAAWAHADKPAPVFAYKIVGLAGEQTVGESSVAFTLATAPTAVRAIQRDDGTRLILWDPSPHEALRGYYVYRQDVFERSAVFRQNSGPAPVPMYIDTRDWPRADRRKYYVVPVDYLGQLGVPSPGVYSHGAP